VDVDRDPQRALIDLLAGTGDPLDYAAIVRRVADAPVPRLADLATLDLRLPDGSFQRIHVTYADAQLAGVADELRAFDPHGDDTPYAEAAATGVPVRIAPVDDDVLRRVARSPDHLRILRDLAACSLLAVPLLTNGRTIGVLTCVYTARSGREHGAADEALGAELGPLAAIAISHAEVVYQRELLLARQRATTADAAAERARERDVAERRRLAVEAGQIGTWDYDPVSGALRWDARCKEMFGLPPEAQVDYPLFLRAIHPDDRACVDAAVGAALNPATGGAFDREYRVVALDDGTERWVRAVGQGFFDEAGRAIRMIGIVQDVGDRKSFELELDEARANAEAANRAKDEFLAMLGHELRNPLAPILTALELMRLRDPEAFVRERTTIERQVQHLVRLVEDLLDVSRITRGKVSLDRHPVDLADVVAKAIEMASPLLEKQAHRLTTDVPLGLRVDGDEARLAQVIANLLTNAAKYTDAGGDIEVTGDVAAGGHTVELRVRDTGIGIAQELLPKVFDLFTQGERTLDRREGGLGLGLSIARSLVEMHGGTVTAASDGPGRGSTFTVRLPRLDERSLEPPEVEHATLRMRASELVPATARVLIVDDNREAAEVLAQALEATGFSTCVAFDAPQALDRAATFRPDIAVLDIGLPVMDGYELARRLREMPATRTVTLVAITGYGQESDHQASTDAGFAAHLVKPVELRRVTDLLDRLVAGR